MDVFWDYWVFYLRVEQANQHNYATLNAGKTAVAEQFR
jgi:hypothetical protein